MITFKQHIDMMGVVRKGMSPTDYADQSMGTIERLDYYRDFMETYPINDHIKTPSFDKSIYTRIEELVLGQFIMVEQIITGKTKLPDHLVDYEIAKLIIRPKEHKEFDNSDPELEKKNGEDILSYDVREVYWVLEKMIANRNKTLFKDFSGVFYEAPSDDDEEDNQPEEKTAQMLFNQQWYWYSIVRMLSGEDIHKYEDTYMLPMSIVLPEMSFIAQQSKIEAANQRQRQALSKL